ncbi:MAG TPA: S8 family serine peptidase [Micromonosporaceae bacterium]
MSQFHLAGLRRPASIALAAATVTAFALGTGGSANAHPPSDTTADYIVQLAGAPLASYEGGVAGIPATHPGKGQKLDTRSPQARAYRDFLDKAHVDVLATAGVDTHRKVYDYDVVFNGFLATLTSTEAAKLESTPGVANVFKNTTVTIQTATTPTFLGLDGSGGVWQQQFGDVSHAGEGVIVGDIDTGFWPESPSFAPLSEPRPDQAVIDAKWHGTCDAGQDHPVTCNNKVIGARWFDLTGKSASQNPGEFHSPRDFDGHGSHTASTAAGDHGVAATINGVPVGNISGMAPAARLAIYKVLYERADGSTASGTSADIVAAINAAVEDGVDVINYSVGDNVDSFGAVEYAFLGAAAAGVFVSAAAGNAGPGASTVDNAMPWEMTVAAGTHDRGYVKSVTLGNGTTYTGVGVGAAVPSSPLVDSVNAGKAGADPNQVELCYPGTLDPAKVTGKIVICERGVIARTDKSLAVQEAGGVGMVLYNPAPSSLNADYHFVPTVHLDQTAGAAIKAYAATAGATASLSEGKPTTVEAPQTASFSSRGPSLYNNGDLLKPDVMAPGVDVIAAVSPKNHHDNLFDTESGTSMATPHIAGIAALIRSKHPDWSPMAVKSAIMTGAVQTDNAGKPITNDNGSPATPFDMGAGFVHPSNDFDPGLVYDADLTDWLQYSCQQGIHIPVRDAQGNVVDSCGLVGKKDVSDYNNPTIAIGDLAGKQTVTRTVTNVSFRAGVYYAHVDAPAGYTVTVSPSMLVVPPHASATFTVTVTRTDATLGRYSFGSLTWTDKKGHDVRSTVAVRSVALAAPGAVSGTGTSGSSSLSIRSGYTGTLTATANGLVPASVDSQHVDGVQQSFDTAHPAAGTGVAAFPVTVPTGTKLARFQTLSGDYGSGADVDMFVYNSSGRLVGYSAGGSATETVTLTAAGTYTVYLVQFALPSGVSGQDLKLYHWAVASGSSGNLATSPETQSVTLGGTTTVTVTWSGLTAGQHYLGLVEYGDGTSRIGTTVVSVDG